MPNRPRPILPALFTLFWAVICGLAALGKIERVNAPRWIFAIMAVVFVLVALHLFAVGPDGRADPDSFLTVWIGPIAISLLALLADWIAFGPGERRGSSTLSLFFFSSSRSAGGTETRIVFGVAGVFFTALAAYAIRGTLLERRTKRLRERVLRRREAARHTPGGGPPQDRAENQRRSSGGDAHG